MKQFCHIYYRIPFSETDAMGIVHHSNHPRLMERGRVEMLRLLGFDYLSMTKKGFHIPVLALNVSYKRPIKFDDIVLVETVITKITKTRLNFGYKAYLSQKLFSPELEVAPHSGDLLFFGESHHCCVNEEGRPVEIDSQVFSHLKPLEVRSIP